MPHAHLKAVDAIGGERCRSLYDIWHTLTNGRVAPRREEITLGHVRKLTPWMWVIDVVDSGADFRFRLAGDRVVQFLGRRHGDARLSEFPKNVFFERMKRTLSHCVEHKRPVAIGPVRSGYEGKEHWEVEFVMLPLSEDGETVTSLMGIMELWPIGTNRSPA